MADGRFAEVQRELHPRISAGLTQERLQAAWEDFVDDHGEVTDIGDPRVEEVNGVLVTIALGMAKRDGQAQVRFLPSGEVVGLDFGEPEGAGT